jgi:hypothetical protein
MIGREGPGPERPGPDYPPEWDREPEEDREECGTCGVPIVWQPGPPPGRPDLPGCWLGEDGTAGVRGSHGHRHAP